MDWRKPNEKQPPGVCMCVCACLWTQCIHKRVYGFVWWRASCQRGWDNDNRWQRYNLFVSCTERHDISVRYVLINHNALCARQSSWNYSYLTETPTLIHAPTEQYQVLYLLKTFHFTAMSFGLKSKWKNHNNYFYLTCTAVCLSRLFWCELLCYAGISWKMPAFSLIW